MWVLNILTFAKLHFLFFDGRAPEFYGGAVHSALRCIRDASYLVFSVPAYWGSISGAAKNFFDVLAGPAYDNPSQCSLFSGKKIGFIVVGGSEGDSDSALVQLESLARAFGSDVSKVAVTVDNPRSYSDMPRVIRECFSLPFRLVQKGPRLYGESEGK